MATACTWLLTLANADQWPCVMVVGLCAATEYTESCSDAIALLNKYNERKPLPMATSKGTAFAKKGRTRMRRRKRRKTSQTKVNWKRRTSMKTRSTSSATRSAMEKESVSVESKPTTATICQSKVSLGK